MLGIEYLLAKCLPAVLKTVGCSH